MANRKNLEEKIAAAKAEAAQIDAHIKQLLHQQKEVERKARNHRLCQRGGQVEKLLPGLAQMNDEQFNTFVQKTLLSGFAAKIIRELLPSESANEQDSGNAAQKSVEATARNSVEPNTANTTKPPQGGAASAAKATEAARQAG